MVYFNTGKSHPTGGDGTSASAGSLALESSTTSDRLCERILAEYREMPGLQLTAAQAARLWALERGPCEQILQTLVAARRLRRTAAGRFCAPGDLECAQRLSWRHTRGAA